jgi:hypothetical protein
MQSRSVKGKTRNVEVTSRFLPPTFSDEDSDRTLTSEFYEGSKEVLKYHFLCNAV